LYLAGFCPISFDILAGKNKSHTPDKPKSGVLITELIIAIKRPYNKIKKGK
jgi:hypothetical protein